jgi:multidrug efflux system membrane fusion protein
MLKHKFRWLVVGGLVIVVAGVVIARVIASKGSRLQRHTRSVPVKVAKARRATVPLYLSGLGTVVAYRTVTIEPMVTGPLLRVFFHEGQNVRKGQLLAEIDPKPFAASLRQAEAKLAQDQATLESNELTARQDALLVKKGFVSRQTYIAALSAWRAAKAQVKQDEAAVESSRINLDYTRIRAPISGRTGILQVDPGNIVNPNLANGIVTINTLQPVYVQFSLPQQDLPQIVRAMESGPVPLIATLGRHKDTESATVHRGALTMLDNQVSTSTGTLTLRGRFQNSKLDLWPGAYVDVRVRIKILPHAVVVPATAVHEGPAGAFVYLVERQPGTRRTFKAVVHPVTVTYDNGALAAIGTGLAPGETVVTEGGSRIRARTPITIVGGEIGKP